MDDAYHYYYYAAANLQEKVNPWVYKNKTTFSEVTAWSQLIVCVSSWASKRGHQEVLADLDHVCDMTAICFIQSTTSPGATLKSAIFSVSWAEEIGLSATSWWIFQHMTFEHKCKFNLWAFYLKKSTSIGHGAPVWPPLFKISSVQILGQPALFHSLHVKRYVKTQSDSIMLFISEGS